MKSDASLMDWSSASDADVSAVVRYGMGEARTYHIAITSSQKCIVSINDIPVTSYMWSQIRNLEVSKKILRVILSQRLHAFRSHPPRAKSEVRVFLLPSVRSADDPMSTVALFFLWDHFDRGDDGLENCFRGSEAFLIACHDPRAKDVPKARRIIQRYQAHHGSCWTEKVCLSWVRIGKR